MNSVSLSHIIKLYLLMQCHLKFSQPVKPVSDRSHQVNTEKYKWSPEGSDYVEWELKEISHILMAKCLFHKVNYTLALEWLTALGKYRTVHDRNGERTLKTSVRINAEKIIQGKKQRNSLAQISDADILKRIEANADFKMAKSF